MKWRGEGRGSPLLVFLCLALVRCSCELPPESDAGTFACTTDDDCAEGYFCAAGRCAPDGSTLPDGGAGGGAAGGAGGGGDPGSRPALRFTSAPHTVAANRCSPPVTFELVDDAGMPFIAPSPITVTITSALSTFSDPSCQSSVGQLQLRADAGLYFSGATPGTFALGLTSFDADPASQAHSIVPLGMPRLAVTTAPPPVQLAGSCIGPITVEARDEADAPLPAPAGGRRVDLLSAPGGLRFSLQASCGGMPPTSVTIAAGQTSADVYVSSSSGRDYTLTFSSAGLASAMLAVPLRPVVRSGTCTLAMNEVARACPITPPHLDPSRTFLTYQASSPAHDPSSSSVACVLGDAGSVTCQRFADGGGFANVTWQTAELANARIDRYDFRCPTDGGDATLIPLAATVQPAQQFVLTAASAFGSDLSGNDFFTVTPTATQLTVHWSNGCNVRRAQLQVVQVPGFTTARATGALVGTRSTLVTGLPVLGGDGFTTVQWRMNTPGNGENRVCDRMVRSALSGGTSVSVSRAADNLDPQCTEFNVDAWGVERIATGARANVQELTVGLDAGVLSATRTITAVDLTRTLVFTSGQSGGAGQGGGEGALPVDGGGFLGEVSATLRLPTSTLLQVDRTSARSAAVFTVYVVELNP